MRYDLIVPPILKLIIMSLLVLYLWNESKTYDSNIANPKYMYRRLTRKKKKNYF